MALENETCAPSPFTHILVPADGTESSINAGRLAIRIAAGHKIPITFLYVVDQSAAEVCQQLENKAHSYLDYLSRMASNRGIRAKKVIRRGVPYREISDLAREESVDLIVIGRVGGMGTQQLARIGAVAERVIEYAPCPVLTVRYRPRRR
jgi:nucleotide-binding universal stress UspA family protein